jgi:hypothetical protein
MKIVGCDLHAKQQSIAMVDTETGEFTEKTLSHFPSVITSKAAIHDQDKTGHTF